MKRMRATAPWLLLLAYWSLLFTSTHIPRPPHLQIYGRDVTLHFTAYLILTILFWLVRYGKSRPSLRQGKMYFLLLVVGCYGAIDEMTQHFVGRYCDFGDWLSDMAGCSAALVLLFFMRRWVHWLVLYWTGMFVITHWPTAESMFVKLPDFWQQFQVLYIVAAYLILTLLWWRTLSKGGRFMINKAIVVMTLIILPAYALLDEGIAALMHRGFDMTDFLAGLGGIILGVLCSSAMAWHHVATDPYENTVDKIP